MRYLRIVCEGLDYKNIDLTLMDFIEDFPAEYNAQKRAMFNRHNIALKKFWKTPSTQLVDSFGAPDGPTPDISLWSYGCLFLSPRATRFLEDSLKAQGELLPIEIGNEIWSLYNCLTFYPSEKVTVTTYKSGASEGLVKSIKFEPIKNFNASIFKAHATIGRHLYCSQNLANAIASFELDGVDFTEKLVETFE